MSEDRTLDATSLADDAAADIALRPVDLHEFVGQDRVKAQLSLVLDAATARNSPAEHILLSGPPGLGKTTLAMIIGAHMNAPVRITSGRSEEHTSELQSH